VNGKGRDITDTDLVKAAAMGGVAAKKVKEMVAQVVEALRETAQTQ